MSPAFRAALETLFRAGFAEFVAERKRLAAELKAAGEKVAPARLAKLARPPVSAWAVNQLWWNERDAFEALLKAAAAVKRGERDASKQHRDALSTLRQHAATLLLDAGNAASEATLRRIATTLSAVAAIGGFEPDAPGTLTADRDPPGFETFVASATTPAREAPPSRAERDAAAAQQRAEEEERKRRAAERERLSEQLRQAQQLKGSQQREIMRLRAELEAAEQDLKRSQALLTELETRLSSL